jgi:hypothetical protein
MILTFSFSSFFRLPSVFLPSLRAGRHVGVNHVWRINSGRLLSDAETCVIVRPANAEGIMFEVMDWLGVVVGAVASFVAGWYFCGADPMGASFGSLMIGLILCSTWVGAMVAHGLTGLRVLGSWRSS